MLVVLQRRIGDGFPASEIREAESGGMSFLLVESPQRTAGSSVGEGLIVRGGRRLGSGTQRRNLR
jgi:hypothetical protein